MIIDVGPPVRLHLRNERSMIIIDDNHRRSSST
jgi:hypothetical protein